MSSSQNLTEYKATFKCPHSASGGHHIHAMSKDELGTDQLTDDESFVDWSSEDSGDEAEGWSSEKVSSCVSQEELNALKGCVSRRRRLFSPRSYQAASLSTASVFQELPHPALKSKRRTAGRRNASSNRRSSLYEHKRVQDSNSIALPSATASGVPDSVSVQFGRAGYECQTVRESNSKPVQHRHGGLNITAMSKSDFDIDVQKPDRRMGDANQCLALSYSIPGELNSSSLRFQDSTFSALNVPSCEQCTCRNHKSLYNSWSRQQLYQSKQLGAYSDSCKRKMACSHCSPQNTPQFTPLSSPNRSPQLQRAKSHQVPSVRQFSRLKGRGDAVLKPYIPSSYDLGSTFSISSNRSMSSTSSVLCGRPHISYSPGVDGQTFKNRTEVSIGIFNVPFLIVVVV